MPDLSAGTTVYGEDTPPPAHDAEAGSYTFTITTWGTATTGGTYADCADVFTAPTSGRVLILFGGHLLNSTTAGTQLSPQVREGAVVGSGTEVAAPTVDEMVQVQGTSGHRIGQHRFVDGLTPGDDYNVRLLHQVSSASTGTALRRNLTVIPVT
jgi:hypothetical protein